MHGLHKMSITLTTPTLQ